MVGPPLTAASAAPAGALSGVWVARCKEASYADADAKHLPFYTVGMGCLFGVKIRSLICIYRWGHLNGYGPHCLTGTSFRSICPSYNAKDRKSEEAQQQSQYCYENAV